MMWHISHTSSHNSANNAPSTTFFPLCWSPTISQHGRVWCVFSAQQQSGSVDSHSVPHTLRMVSPSHHKQSPTSGVWLSLHWLVAVSVFGLLALVTVSAAATDHTPCEPCSAKCCDVCPPHTHTQWCGVLGHALFSHAPKSLSVTSALFGYPCVAALAASGIKASVFLAVSASQL